MCYSCGCLVPDNESDPRNITEKTFQEAAKANGETVDQTKRNVLELLTLTLHKRQHPAFDSVRKHLHLHHS